MADIELIIKIPEETYYATLKRKQLAIYIYEWIKNGVPLPKLGQNVIIKVESEE